MTHYLLQGLGSLHHDGLEMHFEFNASDEAVLRVRGLVADGRQSGLVLGPLHLNGGILLLRRVGSRLRVIGEMEGWEYIFAAHMRNEFLLEIEALNASERGSPQLPLEEFDIPPLCRVIDCRVRYGMMLEVDVDSQFIVNRPATRRHLIRLLELNRLSKAA